MQSGREGAKWERYERMVDRCWCSMGHAIVVVVFVFLCGSRRHHLPPWVTLLLLPVTYVCCVSASPLVE